MGHSEALRGVMDGSAWDEFCEHLRRAGHSVIEAAPDDALDRAEGLRYVGRIAKHALQSFIEQSDPAAPVISGLPKLGGDNPDYVYASAPLSAAHEYRLRGNVGDAHYLGFGSYSGEVGTEEGLRCSGYLGGTDIVTDAQGDFEIVVSSEARPRNWLPMQPDTTQLMVRQTVADRRNQRPASFEIERTDGAWTSGPLDPVGYAGQLARAGSYVEGAIAQFLGWTRRFASRPNEIRRLDSDLAAGAQGDPFTHYYAGYYQITEDQTLVIGTCSCATTGSSRWTSVITRFTSIIRRRWRMTKARFGCWSRRAIRGHQTGSTPRATPAAESSCAGSAPTGPPSPCAG
jgi:hypothetical protein